MFVRKGFNWVGWMWVGVEVKGEGDGELLRCSRFKKVNFGEGYVD